MKATIGQIVLTRWNQNISLFKGSLIATLILLTAGSLIAQQPDRGFQAANSYASTGLETINTANGNMMLNIPLASLPKGRGTSPGYTVTLQYNSKIWDSFTETFDNGLPNEGGNGYYSINTLSRSDRGGWTIHSGFSLRTTDRQLSEGIPNVCRMNDPVEHISFRWKVEMDMPDGSVRQFFPETGRSQWVGMWEDGYANVDPNGTTYFATQGEQGGLCTVNQNFGSVSNSGMTYITMDGSRLRLFIPYVPNSQPITAGGRNWKLYFPDGTTVENVPPTTPEVGQRMTDRNGNTVEHRAEGITDQLGRSIQILMDANGDYVVNAKGVGGEVLQTRLKMGSRFVYRKFRQAPSNTAPTEFRYKELMEQIPVITQIIFPQQLGEQTLDFEYNASIEEPKYGEFTEGWGEINKITAPTAAYSTFEYDQPGLGGDETIAPDILGRYTVHKNLNYHEQYDGIISGLQTDSWVYSVSPTGNGYQGPSGSLSGNTLYGPIETWKQGLAYGNGNADGSVTEQIWAHDMPYSLSSGTPVGPAQWNGVGQANAYVKTEFVTLPETNGNITSNSLTAIKDYKYDKNGNVLEIKEYDWVTRGSVLVNGVLTMPSSGLTLKRKTVNTYYNQAADADSNVDDSNTYNIAPPSQLKNVLKSTEIRDGGDNIKTRSEFYYDNPDTKGNLKETRSWDSSSGALASPDASGSRLNSSNSISTYTEYDEWGSPVLQKDANGNQTRITYGNIAGPNGNVDKLYPTQTETAYGTSIRRTFTATYDFFTGLPLTGTDVDNGVTNAREYDALGRPVKVITAQGSALESWVRSEYSTVDRRVIVRADVETKGDGRKVSIEHYDELGRLRLSRTLENALTEDPYNESDGIKIQTRYRYDDPANPENSNGVYVITSNPYRAATSGAATGESTFGWTLNYADRLGKHSEISTFAGTGLPAPWGGNASTTGVVKSDKDANRMLVTDQAGRQRISRTNALGQLTDVWEVTQQHDSATEPVTFPGQINIDSGYRTSYIYGLTGNLSAVSQGEQTRSFSHNSLARLTSSTTPESGTVAYQYYANGNVKQKVDARNVLISYTYDALNRVTQRSYSGETSYSTPTVTFEYDGEPHAKGKLTKIANSISTTQYSNFDIAGKALKSKQLTDGVDYEISYVFSLSGALIEEVYPNGRKVKNVLNNDGSLSLVESKKNASAGYWNYASNFSYAPSGAVVAVQLGNGHWESTNYNSRLQPTRIALGTTQNSTDLLKLDYNYGTTQNNGNVLNQQITVPTANGTPGFTASQNYSYDSLNRLYDAAETISGSQTWKQTFAYDRFGNRRFDTSSNRTTTLEANCAAAVCNPEINQANNRLIGTTFDSAGNTAVAGGTSQQYLHDGENKMVQVKDVSNTVLGVYYYDGEGKRVKKYVPGTGEVTIFVYDVSSKTIAEYSTQLAEDHQVSYLTSDSLGTPRINTNATGTVIARHDYHPFGEEIFTPVRTSAIGYDSDEIRKKFTGYEHDNETELDFAEARYFHSGFGRFTTPDILLSSGVSISPITWNRYIYSLDNPLKFVDPSGFIVNVVGDWTDEPQTPRRVYIFVFLSSKEQSSSTTITETDRQTHKKKTTAINNPAPDFEKLKKMAAKGVEVVIKGIDATVEDFQNALQDENATVIFVGHGSGLPLINPDGTVGRFVASALLIGGNEGDDTRDYYDDSNQVEVKASMVALFGCDTANIANLFKGAGNIIAVDSGTDGETSSVGMAHAAYATAAASIRGDNPDKVTVQANSKLKSSVGPHTIMFAGRKVSIDAVKSFNGDKVVKVP